MGLIWSLAAYEGEDEAWQKNCIVHTSPWSPCSKTCGLGISTRISNDNDQCRLLKESRLCNMRPCEVDITKHIKVGTAPLHSPGALSGHGVSLSLAAFRLLTAALLHGLTVLQRGQKQVLFVLPHAGVKTTP